MESKFTSESLPDAIKSLFEQNNYIVTGPEKIHGAEVDLIARPKGDPFGVPVYIEATVSYVDNDKYGKDLSKLAMIHTKEPSVRCLIISTKGFSLPVKERANATRIDTLTYGELFSKFERFEPYISTVFDESNLGQRLTELNNIYEEPFFDDMLGKEGATTFLTSWRDNKKSEKRWLIIIGEYGTGKTALTQILQYRWSIDYQHNASLPIPFRIELRDFTRQFNARGLIHHFLDSNNLGHLPIEFVFSLIRSGRIILLLDGYDEMAQYLHARERRVCLESLAELSSDGAKGILTSRPNYFSEAEEFRVFEILYSSISQYSIQLSATDKNLVEREKRIDELIESHFLNRYERILKDLSPEQTESLVKRRLKDDPDGCKVVLQILNRIFRNMEDSDTISLSGKPVIIAYLLEVVDQLKEQRDNNDKMTEWQVYKLILDQLMMRDYRRSTVVLPGKRRSFLHSLSYWLSKRDNPFISEQQFRELIKKEFSAEIRRRIPEEREQAIENYFADLRSSATLTRTGDLLRTTGWKFSHNSLREFLLTEYLLENYEKYEFKDFQIPISDPMRIFVNSKNRRETETLHGILCKKWPERHSTSGLGQILTLLWDAILRLFEKAADPVRACLESLSGGKVALSGVTLNRLHMSSELRPTNLDGANFANCDISDVYLPFASCNNADFSGSMIENVNLCFANIKESNFTNCVIIDVNMSGTIITDSDFTDIDPESSIFIEKPFGENQLLRIEGYEMLGYLRYHGAKTDTIPNKYVYKYHPKFAIIAKICKVLTTQNAHQRLGLEKRGTSKLDPKFASSFISYLKRQKLVETKRNRPGMIWVTARGREVFGKFIEEDNLPIEIEEFLHSKIS